MNADQVFSLRDWARHYYSSSREVAARMASKWTPEWQARFASYVQTMQHLVGPGGRALDVGIGGGQTTYGIAAQAGDVICG